jgi:nitrite reductase/ring-hydroxylating ferredoxin subunit/multimeric flavodoxin WrbA
MEPIRERVVRNCNGEVPMSDSEWIDLGPADAFKLDAVAGMEAKGQTLAIARTRAGFAAVSGVCAHLGGPLGEGELQGNCIVCPWHGWRVDATTGKVAPEDGEGSVSCYRTDVRQGHLWVEVVSAAASASAAQPKVHPLAREITREEGPIRVAGISTTAMNRQTPRYSTSEKLLQIALDYAAGQLGVQTRLIRLNELDFRHCEGYYSNGAASCIWPCTITQSDPADGMQQVYEALVHWADVIMIATPIRWGVASSLYFKMAERMNCIQNQITTHDRVLIQNKVASFIITGGQDNIQAVAGQMLTFFAELGYHFPQFPFIAHSRGWSAEDMERNIDDVEHSDDLRCGAQELAARSVAMAAQLIARGAGSDHTPRGGRKAFPLTTSESAGSPKP